MISVHVVFIVCHAYMGAIWSASIVCAFWMPTVWGSGRIHRPEVTMTGRGGKDTSAKTAMGRSGTGTIRSLLI